MTRVPSLPLLAPWYRVAGDDERLLLEHAQSLVVLEGAAVRALLPALLPLLDGTHTVEALADRLGRPALPAIEAALALLSERGVVVEGPDAPVDRRNAARAVAAAYGLSPAAASTQLREAEIALVGSGRLRFELARILHEAGIGGIRRRRWRGSGPADLTVVVPASDEYDRLHEWNATALRLHLRWLLVRPFDGRSAAAGPVVVPGQTCCYECLLLRRGANAGYARELRELEAAPFASPPDPALDSIVAALAAHLAVRFVVGGDKTLPGVLYTLELHPAIRLTEHLVLRVPRCGECSVAVRYARPLPWHQASAA